MSIPKLISSSDLRPFSLDKTSIAIRLFLACHGRKKTISDRLRNKLATLLLKMLRKSQVESKGTARLNASNELFQFNSKNLQFHSIYEYGDRGYEIDVMAIILTFLPSNGVLVDVGANWGYFAIATAGDPAFEGSVHAFEAFPRSFCDLQSIQNQLNISPQKLQTHCVALSNERGSAFLGGGDSLYSGLVKISEKKTGIEVAKMPLDDLGLTRLDVLKIDVEGHELNVLQGSVETLKKCRPIVVLENWHDLNRHQGSEIACLNFLVDQNYRLYVPAITDPEGRTVWLDLRHSGTENLQLRGMPFRPDQRGFFDTRLNVLAIPTERETEVLV